MADMATKLATEDAARRERLARDIVRSSFLVGDFILSSGKRSHYYFDKYLFETKPYILRPLAKVLAKSLPPQVDRLAAPEMGGIALAAAVSLEAGIPFVIVKEEGRPYHQSKRVEGEIYPGERIVVIEDVFVSGTRAIATAEEVRAMGAEVLFILGVVDREEGARDNIASAGFQMESLFTKKDLESHMPLVGQESVGDA